MPHPDALRYLQENAQYPRETLWRKLREAGYPDAEILAAEACLGEKSSRSSVHLRRVISSTSISRASRRSLSVPNARIPHLNRHLRHRL